MIKKRHTAVAALSLSLLAVLLTGPAASAATISTYDWSANDKSLFESSGSFTVGANLVSLKTKMNTGAKFGFEYTNPVYSITDVRFRLERLVNGNWVDVGTKNANVGTYMNWGARTAGTYHVYLLGFHSDSLWLGQGDNVYLISAKSTALRNY